MHRSVASRFSTVARIIEKADADKLWRIGHSIDEEDVDLNSVVGGENMELFEHPMIENTSHQYSPPELLRFDDCMRHNKPLWWLVLRQMKEMLLKIARSYHAKPLMLVIAPLFFGIFLGFWIAKFSSRSQSVRSKNSENTFIIESPTQQEVKNKRIYQPLIGRLRAVFSAFWHRLSSTTTLCISQGTSLIACTNILRKGGNSTAEVPMDAVVTGINGSVPNCGKQSHEGSDDGDIKLVIQENKARKFLKSNIGTVRECGVSAERIPRHIAVIMDGNRRYGKSKYGSVAKGHWDGSSKLVEFAKWCIAEGVAVLTVFAFSSENWRRDPSEIASLMQIFARYCDELRLEAIERNIKIMVLSTDYEKIPTTVRIGVERMVQETRHCNGMIMNICLSYGSRGEIVRATKSVVEDVLQNQLDPNYIDENTIGEKLLTHNCGGDPDVLIRTSGEVRISNFLLWQSAYTELFFVDKPWPAIEKSDLLKVIQTYAMKRNRRFGK